MFLPPRLAACLLAAGLLAAPARAADFDKYLLDDTDAVLTVNVKQVVASPLYTKSFKQQVEGLLKMEPVAALLKGTDFDPLKDVERVTVVMSRSCFGPDGPTKVDTPEGPLMILQGNVDAAKLKALVERAGKELPVKIKEDKIGNTAVWVVSVEEHRFGEKVTVLYYFAAPEKGVVIFASIKDHMTAALEKASGKRKTQLKSKAMSELLARMDVKASASWAATGDMIFGTSQSTFKKVGKEIKGGDKKECEAADEFKPEVKHHPLSESGVSAAIGSVTVADEIKGQTTLTFADADKAQTFAKQTQDGLNNGIKLLSAQKELAPLVEAMKSVKIKAQDKSVALEGQAKAEAIDAVVKLLLLDRPAPKSR
jgi:hypothetical protein